MNFRRFILRAPKSMLSDQYRGSRLLPAWFKIIRDPRALTTPTIKCRLPVSKVKIHSDTFSLRSTPTSLRNFSLSAMMHGDPQYLRLDDLPFTTNVAAACVND
jgi:hypothetical protein